MELVYYAILAAVAVISWSISYWIVPYFTTYKHLRHIPGPFVGKFSNLWLASGARQSQKFAWVEWAHRKYGKVVRLGFNHVSIATPEGLRIVYAHGNGFLKDTFYNAFVSGVPGVFNVRDRTEHSRKRKIVAHAFSPGAVQDFEPHMTSNLIRWVGQLDRISAHPDQPNGFARINMMPWCTFIAFDIIGDLAFGAPFGMVERGRDECEAAVPATGKTSKIENGEKPPTIYVSGAETLNRRGEVSSTLGLLPQIRPFAKYLPDPFFSQGLKSVANLHGIAVAAVDRRLGSQEAAEKGEAIPGKIAAKGRHDILEMLTRAKDSNGQPIGRTELISEALTQLIAGSDTVSNTACAIFYWIMHGERAAPGTIVPQLQAELDAAIPSLEETGINAVARHSQVKNLPFLRRCIDEAMRLHSTSALGLPRIVTAPEGIRYDDEHFPKGTVLSVPSYTIHHDEDIWGPDVDEFRPDRWLTASPRQRMAFNPFSFGPRSCVGQNVAHMELALIIGTAFRRYDFALYQDKLLSQEGFSKKPVDCFMGIRRR